MICSAERQVWFRTSGIVVTMIHIPCILCLKGSHYVRLLSASDKSSVSTFLILIMCLMYSFVSSLKNMFNINLITISQIIECIERNLELDAHLSEYIRKKIQDQLVYHPENQLLLNPYTHLIHFADGILPTEELHLLVRVT